MKMKGGASQRPLLQEISSCKHGSKQSEFNSTKKIKSFGI
jgi:hypothetical protein